jgi:hypothetical protein
MENTPEIAPLESPRFQNSDQRKHFRFTSADVDSLQAVKAFYGLKTETDTILFLLEKESKIIKRGKKQKTA